LAKTLVEAECLSELGDLNDSKFSRRLYITNQLLYCQLRAGRWDRTAEMAILAKELAHYKGLRPHVWWWTYHDTLARYFGGLAERCNDPALWKFQMDNALDHARIASAHARSEDSDVKGYLGDLISRQSIGFYVDRPELDT